MTRRWWIAVTATLALAGCEHRRASPEAGAGLPTLTRPWTVAEQTQAAVTIERLCRDAPTQLPSFGSPAFARMVAPENRLVLAKDQLEARQRDLTAHTAAHLQMYAAYVQCGRLGEALALNAALLEGYAESIAVGRAIRDAAADGSPDRARADRGLEHMTVGLVGGIGSTFGMLSDTSIPGVIPVEVGARLGAAIAAVRDDLPTGALDAHIAALRQAIATVTDPDRKQALAAAAAAL